MLNLKYIYQLNPKMDDKKQSNILTTKDFNYEMIKLGNIANLILKLINQTQEIYQRLENSTFFKTNSTELFF